MADTTTTPVQVSQVVGGDYDGTFFVGTGHFHTSDTCCVALGFLSVASAANIASALLSPHAVPHSATHHPVYIRAHRSIPVMGCTS